MMVTELKPYPEYKDSGVPWLGQVPDNWTVQRLSASITDFVAGTWGGEPNTTDDTICVRVADFDRSRLRVRINRPTIRAIAPADLRRKRLRRGDLLLEKSGGGDLQPVGVVMLFDHEEVAVCSNFVARMSVTTGFEPEFLTYLHTTLYSIGLNVRSIKQTTGIQNLDCRAYLSESVAFPPLSEQVAIVQYLNHADRKVRHAIRARQQLIKLLTEQKQAIIQRAVTRGLDPNVRLKPSGVPWLGDVPEYWEILRLKDACQRIVGGSTPRSDKAEYWNGDVVWVTPIDVTRSQRLDTSLRRITREGLNSCSATLVPAGSIIVTCRAPVGKVAVAATELCTNQGCKAVVLRSEVLTTAFGALLMQTLEPELQSLANGTTFSEIPLHKLACVPIPVPAIDEQITIVHHIEEASASLDKAIDAARREIDLLREYRTRFIADVVTGKLDVRDVTVPADETDAMPEELESIDDVEAIDQTDDVAEGDSESSSEERA